MNAHRLRKGENTTLPDDARRVQLVMTWNDPDGDRDVDASALLLSATRKVRSDRDFIFYNQPDSPDGAVHHLGKTSTEAGPGERIAVDLDALPGGVESVVVTASVDGGQFGDLSPLQLSIVDSSGSRVASYEITDATVETAIVFGEVYRRNGDWKLRAVGQGWHNGLAGLARDFGIDVEDESDSQPAAVAVTTASATGSGAPHKPVPTTETDSLLKLAIDSAVDGNGTIGEVAPSAENSESIPIRPAGTNGASIPRDTFGPLDAHEVSPTPRRIRTRRPKAVKVPQFKPALADDDTWKPARLFSVNGISNDNEREQRVTSALLSTMTAVRPFARGITARLGAPAGPVETFTEVSFEAGERKLRPDGVIRTTRAGRMWTALVEIKVGSNQLRHEQVENYVSIARAQGFDAVVTISNDICPVPGEHPIKIDKRRLKNVALVHLSWAEILYEARTVRTYRSAGDGCPDWLLAELIRYLEHPSTGATGFADMGAAWMSVRDAVANRTFRASDRHAAPVADAWLRLVQYMRIRLSTRIGAEVKHVISRRIASDPAARVQEVVTQLANHGTLDATLRVPDGVGPMVVAVDLRANSIRVGVTLQAPTEGTARRRVRWLLEQLGESVPADLLVEVHFADGGETSCERLGDARSNPTLLLGHRDTEVTSFQLSQNTPTGVKRSGIKGAFIPSVTNAVEAFYENVFKGLRPLARHDAEPPLTR